MLQCVSITKDFAGKFNVFSDLIFFFQIQDFQFSLTNIILIKKTNTFSQTSYACLPGGSINVEATD